MDPKEKNNSVTFNHDKVKRRKRKAETAVDNISDEPIYSLCQPAVDGKNAPQKSPTVKKTKKTLRKQTNMSSPVRDLDMDVVIPGRVEKGTYGNPKANNIGPKHSKSVEKAKKPLEISTKTSSPLCDKVEDSDDDGKDEQEQHKKTRTTGGPVEKSETTTSKQNTKNVQKLPSKSKRAREGEKVFAKQQHVEKPSSRRREGAAVSVEKVIRHDQRHDKDIKKYCNVITAGQK